MQRRGFGNFLSGAIILMMACFSGLTVLILLRQATAALIAVFPAGSGAAAIVLVLGLLWGVVTAGFVALFGFRAWPARRDYRPATRARRAGASAR